MVIAKLMMLMCVLMVGSLIDAKPPTTYTVGDEFGWTLTIDMGAWAKGKTFYAGDYLVFKYDEIYYNVVVDDKEGFDACIASDNSTTYNDGYNKLQVVFGKNYFMCGHFVDCQAGMKMTIDGKAPPPLL
ncbi:basic blue protein-like [Mercurialis annua]|uniref:basic blue protein-like n=1 Tax=Mercurialis annua TaxID=3986 RepID=UPI00215F99CC|nr:basic blue protein-like [Mercurialis annua]